MILFRCSADAQVGMGHLSRCRVLATELHAAGHRVAIYGPPEELQTLSDRTVFSSWTSAEGHASSLEDAQAFLGEYRRLSGQFVVLDDYRVDEPYQLLLRSQAIRWLQFQMPDQTAIWSDIVLCANPAVTRGAFDAQVRNPQTTFLLGGQYALLRPDFRAPVRFDAATPVPRQIFMSFGAGDDRGAIRKVVETIQPHVDPSTSLFIVSGRQNPGNIETAHWIDSLEKENIQYLIEPENLFEIMRSSDLAIVSGGTMTYELAACGVPMLIVAIAANQQFSAAWQELGAGLFLGYLQDVPDEVFVGAFLDILGNPGKREELSLRARSLVDGYGAERVAKVIEEAM